MDRFELKNYLINTYGAILDTPWDKYPNYWVFRKNSKKCFAFVLDIPKSRLGIKEEGIIDIVNLKISPYMIGSALTKKGFYPAYHMNKEHWVSVILDGTIPEDELKMFVDISFQLVNSKNAD